MQIVTPQRPVATGRPVLVTTGVFDGVHRGHVHLLHDLCRQAAEKEMEPVAVTFSNHPLDVVEPGRAPRRLTSLAQRLALMEMVGLPMCLLLEFDARLMSLTATGFIDYLKGIFTVGGIMAGYNNRVGRRGGPIVEEACKECGVEFVRSTEYDLNGRKVSSSHIRGMLEKGDVEAANESLGRLYTLSGIVTHGRAIGRTIGFPTANISSRAIDPDKLVPLNGAYACTARVEGLPAGSLPAMVNIGTNPTIDSSNLATTIEVNIIGLDPSAELYGQTVTLGFLSRLRDERRFDSLEQLKRQLEADRAAAIELFEHNTFNHNVP